jgi:hypothetical protein
VAGFLKFIPAAGEFLKNHRGSIFYKPSRRGSDVVSFFYKPLRRGSRAVAFFLTSRRGSGNFSAAMDISEKKSATKEKIFVPTMSLFFFNYFYPSFCLPGNKELKRMVTIATSISKK